MIISDQQARLALDSLHTMKGDGAVQTVCPDREVPIDLLDRVNELLAQLPDTRIERVAQARADLLDHRHSSEAVADKIIARIISDSLR